MYFLLAANLWYCSDLTDFKWQNNDVTPSQTPLIGNIPTALSWFQDCSGVIDVDSGI